MYFHIVEVASDMISIWGVEFWLLIHVAPDGERGEGGVGEDHRPKPGFDAVSGRMEKKTKEVVNQIMSSLVFSHNIKLEKIREMVTGLCPTWSFGPSTKISVLVVNLL